MESNHHRVSEAHEADRARTIELAKERQSLLLPARVFGEERAKERLRAVDSELRETVQRVTDGETMISQLDGRLAPLRAWLDGAESEQRRQEALREIDSLIAEDLDAKLSEALESLKELLARVRERDARIEGLSVFYERREPGQPLGRAGGARLSKMRAESIAHTLGAFDDAPVNWQFRRSIPRNVGAISAHFLDVTRDAIAKTRVYVDCLSEERPTGVAGPS
jgi:vacuolar-type H+-ATPase subunit I/STV1